MDRRNKVGLNFRFARLRQQSRRQQPPERTQTPNKWPIVSFQTKCHTSWPKHRRTNSHCRIPISPKIHLLPLSFFHCLTLRFLLAFYKPLSTSKKRYLQLLSLFGKFIEIWFCGFLGFFDFCFGLRFVVLGREGDVDVE